MVRTRHSLLAPDLPAAASSTGWAEDILARTAEVLVSSGCSPRVLAQVFARACQRLPEPTRPATVGLATYVTQLGQLLAHWSTDQGYVDARGTPRKLPMRGRISLSALMKRVLPRENPREIVAALVRGRAIRRAASGYELLRRYVSTAETVPLAHAQSLSSIRGLLQTVQHNVNCAQPADRLLERKAANLFIPRRLMPAVEQHVKHRAGALLEELDRYFGAREVAPGDEPTAQIHFVTFLHEDPLIADLPRGRPRPLPKRQGRKRTPQKRARAGRMS